MIKCPVCQFRNPDLNDKCFKCQAVLKHNPESFKEGLAVAKKKAKRLKIDRLTDGLRDYKEQADGGFRPYKYPFTTAFFSLIPGAGHIYLAQYKKATMYFAAWIVGGIICFFTITNPLSNAFLFAMLFFWIFVISDSIKMAAINNNQPWTPRQNLAVFSWLLCALSVTVLLICFFGSKTFAFIRIQPEIFAPVISKNDLVFVNKTAYFISKPKIGDVIMFKPSTLRGQSGVDVYSVTISQYFQKVVGVAGDRIEKKDGYFFRNGTQIPEFQTPFHGEKLPDFDIMVKDGCVLAPITGIPGDKIMGIPDLGFVGALPINFHNWNDVSLVNVESSGSQILGKAIFTANPPTARRWF